MSKNNMRLFGHTDPTDKHHAELWVRVAKQERRRLNRRLRRESRGTTRLKVVQEKKS